MFAFYQDLQDQSLAKGKMVVLICQWSIPLGPRIKLKIGTKRITGRNKRKQGVFNDNDKMLSYKSGSTLPILICQYPMLGLIGSFH